MESWRRRAGAGHSSQVFGESMGYGAVYEMTRILDEFRRELPETGLTFNVGLVMGGATATMECETETGGEVDGENERDSAGGAGDAGICAH